MSKLKKKSGQSVAQSLVARLKSRSHVNGTLVSGADQHIAGKIASLESLNEGDLDAVSTVAEGAEGELRDVVAEVASDVGADADAATAEEAAEAVGVTETGLEAAAIVALAARDLSAFHSASRKANAPSGNIPVIGLQNSGSAGSIGYGVAVESFDSAIAANHFEESVGYNMLAARQDEFGEAFFKTMVVGPDQAYFVATAERLSVFPGAQHKLDGKPAQFAKRNILEGFRDATLLVNEATDLVPVVDASNTAYFVASNVVPHVTRVIEGNNVTTGALVTGKPIDLIGISSHPALIAAGLMNQNDSVDPRVELSKIYVQVSDGTNTDVLELDAKFQPNRAFIKTGYGAGNRSTLNFKSAAFVQSTATKDVSNNSAAQVFAGLGNDRVFLEAQMFGDINLETGEVELTGKVTAARRIDVDGAQVALGGMASLTFTVIGYKLSARRTNANRRSVGQLLDRDVFQEAYEIGLLAPISAQKPVAPYADAGSVVQQLVTATHVRVSNAAVTTLLNFAESLAAYATVVSTGALTADIYSGAGLEGLARFYVTPYYKKITVNLTNVIANISTKDKLKDVQGFFTSLIQEAAAAALQKSGYLPALRSVSGNQSAKPTLLVGTDQYLPAFMLLQGDDRTAGIALDHKLVSTPDTRMYGKIFLTFGTSADGYQPLNFGNMLWRPELVSEIPVNRNGGTVNETMVQPAFRHIVNLPILVEIEVDGLAEAIAQRLIVNTNV